MALRPIRDTRGVVIPGELQIRPRGASGVNAETQSTSARHSASLLRQSRSPSPDSRAGCADTSEKCPAISTALHTRGSAFQQTSDTRTLSRVPCVDECAFLRAGKPIAESRRPLQTCRCSPPSQEALVAIRTRCWPHRHQPDLLQARLLTKKQCCSPETRMCEFGTTHASQTDQRPARAKVLRRQRGITQNDVR